MNGTPSPAHAGQPAAHTFRIVIEPDEDRWRAYTPALEHLGAATRGRTRQEALRHIREVLEMIVAEFVREGAPIPASAPSPDSR